MAHHLRETQSANFLQPGSASSHAFLSALSSRSRCAAAAASFSARRRCPRVSAGIGIVAQIGRGGIAYVGRRYSSRGSCRASWVACSTTPHVGRAGCHIGGASYTSIRCGVSAGARAAGKAVPGAACPSRQASLEGPRGNPGHAAGRARQAPCTGTPRRQRRLQPPNRRRTERGLAWLSP